MLEKLKKSLAFTWVILLISALPSGAYATTTNLTTWNIAWLSTQSYPQYSESNRSMNDFSSLSGYFHKTHADILAFQEVDSADAINKVVGTDYHIMLSDRALTTNSHRQFNDINQYTGFAIRKTFKVHNHPDIDLNPSKNGKLRFASYIEIERNNSKPNIHLLSVHLKAGCQGAKRNNRSCKLLEKQGTMLNQWIKDRQSNRDSFVIMGDFNHNLAYRGDWLWEQLTQGTTNAVLASADSKAKCEVRSNRNPKQTHRFRNLIDHVIVSSDLAFSEPAQDTFSKNDVINYQLSDHCPVSLSIK
ncbi:endonuclease/exonuclease/phosphatase family protein [Vibrio breoganii]|uniref:endonuclease/exonuclease/phosphatase family protein n=1 Tax=Vibrio breoganii TaxID=553239 RepID=UPI000C84AF26|nr:endonuclease/exonuclease/phosphatase family protein [Vibrio breoganii]PMM84297.1 hydrolase [Vibrio breoganii]